MNAQDALRIVEFSGIGFTMEQFNEANSVLRSVVLELSAIKQRGEAHQYVLKLAIDFIDAHPEMLKQVILLKSANEKELEAVNYILKGETK